MMLTLIGLLPAAFGLIFVNELAPRFVPFSGAAAEFKHYALRHIRPYAWSLSGGVFIASAIFDPNNGQALSMTMVIVMAIYVTAWRTFRRAE
jgi:hypothetical protein